MGTVYAPVTLQPRSSRLHRALHDLKVVVRAWSICVFRESLASTLRCHHASTTLSLRLTRLHDALRHAQHHARTTLALRSTRLHDALRHAQHDARTTRALRSLRLHHDQADHTATKRRLHCAYATLIASPLRADHAPTATAVRSDHASAALATIL